MAKFIIIYPSTDGHTKEICLCLQKIIESQHHQEITVSVDQANHRSLNSFEKINIGARFDMANTAKMYTNV